MSQFARPNSDIFTGNFTSEPVSGQPAWSMLDEVSPDETTTYMNSISVIFGSSDTLDVGLSAITDPGIDTGFILRVRAFNDSFGNVTAQASIIQGTSTVISSVNLDLGIEDGNFVTTTYNVPSTDIAAITNFANLSVELVFQDNGSSSSSNTAVTWIELEAPDAGGPSIVAWLTA
jgi:hypothetical protein